MDDKAIDLALVERAQAGDKRAFDLLVIKYQKRVAGLVARYVRDRHEVQDVTQETFVKAFTGLKNFRGDSAFYSWLFRIASNTALNYISTRNKRAITNATDIDDADSMDAAADFRDISDPESEMTMSQSASQIRASIKALPQDLREALIFREFHNYSYEEIGRIVGCPIGTVRSRLYRAREAVLAKLETTSHVDRAMAA